MDIRKLVAIAAALCVVPAFAQNSGGSTGGSSGTDGASAGDGDRPLTYTKASFAELDKDKSGTLDKKEITAATLSSSLVKKLDTNGDGVISEAEFTAYEAINSGNKVPKK